MTEIPDCTKATVGSIAILMPTYHHQVDVNTMESLLSINGLYEGFLSVKGCPDVTIARNRLFTHALQTRYQWFVCLDADVAFERNDYVTLMDVVSNRDHAVNGTYYKKSERCEEVTHGLGFARIHRTVLEAIAQRFPMRYEEDGETFQVFSYTARMDDGRMLRSDSSFWFMCFKLGIVPRLYRSSSVIHYGRYGYRDRGPN